MYNVGRLKQREGGRYMYMYNEREGGTMQVGRDRGRVSGTCTCTTREREVQCR